MTPPLKQALAYVERGWRVLPLRPRDKRPHLGVLEAVHGTRSWKWLRDESPSRTWVEQWYARDPSMNVGIITGDGLAVVDIDQPHRAPSVPDNTPIASTGRGKHVYVKCDPATQTTNFGWGELRAHGAYCCAPASIHATGVAYEWIRSFSHDLAHITDVLDEEALSTRSYQGPNISGLGTAPRGAIPPR